MFKSLYRQAIPKNLRTRIWNGRSKLETYIARFGAWRGCWNFYQLEFSKAGLLRLYVPGYLAPIFLRKNGSDIDVFKDAIWSNVYEHPTVSSLRPRVIVDAGANIGCAAAWFAAKFPDAQIIAIEPDADNVRLLKRNVAPYKVTVVEAALWSHTTRLAIENPNDLSMAFRMSASSDANKGVRTVTMQEVLELSGTGSVDILKMDIEGAELEVLSSDPQWLTHLSGVLVIEVHERFKPGCLDALQNAARCYGLTERYHNEVEWIHIYSKA